MRWRAAAAPAEPKRRGRLTPGQRSFGRSSGPSVALSLSRNLLHSEERVSTSVATLDRASGLHGIFPSDGPTISEVRLVRTTSLPLPVNTLLYVPVSPGRAWRGLPPADSSKRLSADFSSTATS